MCRSILLHDTRRLLRRLVESLKNIEAKHVVHYSGMPEETNVKRARRTSIEEYEDLSLAIQEVVHRRKIAISTHI